MKLADELGEVLVLLAASVVPDRDVEDEQKAEALALNKLAEDCFGKGRLPRALLAQQAGLVTDPNEAKQLRAQAEQTPLNEAWDYYLAARSLLRQGKVQEAIAKTREAVRLDPKSFAAWFLLGNCCLAGGSNAAKMEAAVHYTTCISLQPEFFGPYFNRGLARLAIETSDVNETALNNLSADVDFTRAIELQEKDEANAKSKAPRGETDLTSGLEKRPKLAEAYLQRAIARSRLGKIREAVQDADQALAGGVPPARVYLMRSKLQNDLGEREKAQRDLAEGLKQTPVDCQGWIDRGKARLRLGDAPGGLADFAAAARCNPLSREAIHDQAYVQGELLKRPADAVRLLDRELELDPNQPVIIVCRGIYHAQLGHRDAAIADAKKAVAKAPSQGEVLYRAACVFALTSRLTKDPNADRRQAIGYLARALECGFGFDYVEADTDLAPLQDDPEFAELRTLIDKTRKLKIPL